MNEIAKNRILIVDDETVNLKLIGEILKNDYELAFAKSGEEALQLLPDRPDLILLDIMMPGMDGYQLARTIKGNEEYSAIPIIFISAMNEPIDEIRGLKQGASDYITKPINGIILKLRVKTQFDLLKAQLKLKEYNQLLEQKVSERTKDAQEAQVEMVRRMGLLAEYRDPETGNHIERMSQIAEALATASGLPPVVCQMMKLASPMHDIGKVAIPDRILSKPDRLDAEEWKVMKTHAAIGAKMLEGGHSQLIQTAYLIALHHHEKWDGSGYPQGLKGEMIPIEGRITAIADVFDALASKRPYKEAFPLDKILRIMSEGRGSHFDPRLFDIFLKLLPEILEDKYTQSS